MVVVVACGQWLLFVVIVIAFIYRSSRLVIQLELCPSLSCHHALSTFFWTLPSFVWLGAIVRQTDPSSYTYISLHTRFVGFCGLLTTGRLRFYHSLLLRCFSLFLFLKLFNDDDALLLLKPSLMLLRLLSMLLSMPFDEVSNAIADVNTVVDFFTLSLIINHSLRHVGEWPPQSFYDG